MPACSSGSAAMQIISIMTDTIYQYTACVYHKSSDVEDCITIATKSKSGSSLTRARLFIQSLFECLMQYGTEHYNKHTLYGYAEFCWSWIHFYTKNEKKCRVEAYFSHFDRNATVWKRHAVALFWRIFPHCSQVRPTVASEPSGFCVTTFQLAFQLEGQRQILHPQSPRPDRQQCPPWNQCNDPGMVWVLNKALLPLHFAMLFNGLGPVHVDLIVQTCSRNIGIMPVHQKNIFVSFCIIFFRERVLKGINVCWVYFQLPKIDVFLWVRWCPAGCWTRRALQFLQIPWSSPELRWGHEAVKLEGHTREKHINRQLVLWGFWKVCAMRSKANIKT